jgi:hypothetical protein
MEVQPRTRPLLDDTGGWMGGQTPARRFLPGIQIQGQKPDIFRDGRGFWGSAIRPAKEKPA